MKKPKQKPEPKKAPEPVIESIEARYNFTIEEVGELARKMSAANQRVQEFEERKKQQAADLKAQIDLAQAEVNSLGWKVSNGYEMRQTECVVTFDPKNESKDYHKKSNGEFVTRRTMDRRDFELSLPFEKVKEACVAEQEKRELNSVGEALAAAEAKKEGEQTTADKVFENAVVNSPAPKKRGGTRSAKEIIVGIAPQNNRADLRKPIEWADAAGIVIIEPKGWSTPGASAKSFNEPITFAEYETRVALSGTRAKISEDTEPVPA